MTVETVPFTLDIPEFTYRRLESTARAMRRSLQEIMLHTLNVGSPPAWDDVSAEYQTELAVMDRMEDDALWPIARSRREIDEMERYDELLTLNQNGQLSPEQKLELQALRKEADLFMLRKAHAAALLSWRGHKVPRA